MSYRGKVCVITGAAGGIGSALCSRFGRDGARIAALDSDVVELRTAVDGMNAEGIEAIGIPCDVTDELACRRAVNEIVAQWGAVDVLINNAGITHLSLFERTDPGVCRRVMDVNFFGAVYCTSAALPHLAESKGRIVVVSSVAGFAPLLARTGYCASKHALHGFFDTLRCEVKRHGVSVTVVCPSFTESKLESTALAGDGSRVGAGRSTVGALTPPDRVASAIFRAATKRKRFAVLSGIGKTSWWVRKLAPGLYDAIMSRMFESEFSRI
jgi:NAD(P)-dependent dehydrogenase (short-subunit alcohol dehydrogenase family)